MKFGFNLNNKKKENGEKKPLDKMTILSYIGIGALAILMVIPPIFRVMFAKPSEEVKKEEIIRISLKCAKNDLTETYVLSKTIDNVYEDNMIVSSLFTFEAHQRAGADTIPVLDDIQSEELEQFLALTDSNIKKTKTDTKATFEFNYKKYDFSKITMLNEHRKVAQAQLNIYVSSGYSCDTHTDTIEVGK